MQIELIPVSKLSISARNVRRTTSTAPIDGLKADIKARGVLQNLIAVPANGRKKGRYEVTAGGRRLTVLQALIAEGTLPPDHPVPVMVLSDTAQAGETSLAENFQRAGMNPADECIAFRHFVEEDGSTVEDIARRFGITTRFVEGRLRLAQLAEPVFEALRAGAITLDLAQAFGTTADTRRQEEVWEECKQKSWMLNARHVRQRLTEDVITGHHPVAQFVGEEAYLAAGGEIERDLFGDERETFWKTPDLLARLASEKMDAVAQAMKAEEGFAHIEAYLGSPPPEPEGMVRVYARRRPPTDNEAARIDAIQSEIEALEEQWGYTEEEPDEETRTRWEALEAELDTLRDRPMDLDPELKARAVARLTIGRDGSPTLSPTYYVPASAEPDSDDGVTARPPAGEASSAPKEAPRGLSERVEDELAYDRTALLQLHIATDTALAGDLVAFLLAEQSLERSLYTPRAGFDISARVPSRRVFDHTVEPRIEEALADLRNGLDASWADHRNVSERFDAFRAMGPGMKAAWQAWSIARTLEKTVAGDQPFHDHLGRLLDIRVATWWRPTAANYFGRVRKELVLQALDTVGGTEFRSRYASAKKAELAAAAERIFSGDAIIEPAISQAAVAWVPEQMRFEERGPENDEDGPDEWDDSDQGDLETTDEGEAAFDPAVND
jgi:ParB family chromosome partitioning protein